MREASALPGWFPLWAKSSRFKGRGGKGIREGGGGEKKQVTKRKSGILKDGTSHRGRRGGGPATSLRWMLRRLNERMKKLGWERGENRGFGKLK